METKELNIIDMSVEGDGIARVGNDVYFIDGAVEGETVRAEITKDKDSLHWGNLVEIITPSYRRVEPLCPYFSKCGGCKLMHLSKDTQKLFKKLSLQRTIKKVTNFDIEVGETICGEHSFGYRNSLQLKIGKVDGEVKVGFYESKTHTIVNIDNCIVCGEYSGKLIKIINQYVTDTDADFESVFASYYDGKLLILVQTSSGTCDTNFYDYLKSEFDFVSLWVAKQFATSTLLNYKEAKWLAGDESEIVKLCGLEFNVTPLNFTQINFEVAEIIYKKIVDEIGTNKVVLDLYSGIGVTSVLFAKNENYVCSVEYIEESVNSAKQIAGKYGVSERVIQHTGDCAKVLGTLSFTDEEKENLVVFLDPPRKGAGKQVVDELIKLSPRKIVYMSCNPNSLAKDLRDLSVAYDIKTVDSFDMFPQTNSIESLTILTRK